MKIAGTIEKIIRRVLKPKSCQRTFIMKQRGPLHKLHVIFKSRKTSGIKQNRRFSNKPTIFIATVYFFLYLLFMKKEEKQNNKQNN